MVDNLYEEDLSYSFRVGIRVENDLLIRIRHYNTDKDRISILRLFVHTSFICDNFLRLSKVHGYLKKLHFRIKWMALRGTTNFQMISFWI